MNDRAASSGEFDPLVAAWEKSCKADPARAPDNFLRERGLQGIDGVTSRWLLELVVIQMEYRARRGLSPVAWRDDPELRSRLQLHERELVVEEFRCRRQWGDCPEVAEFRRERGLQSDWLDALNAALAEEGNEWSARGGEHEAGEFSDRNSAALRERLQTQLAAAIDYRDFELRRMVGAGGSGKVYEAWQASRQRLVAVKALRKQWHRYPQAVERFLNEAALLAQVRHGHVVEYFGFGRMPSGILFFAMPWLAGGTLDVYARQERAELSQIMRWMRQIAEGVRAAHWLGILHLDLKPANILLDERGQARVADFGLAISATAANDAPRGVGGTLAYMAPEQWPGDAALLSPATDVYGWGRILLALLHAQMRGDESQRTLDELQALGRRCLRNDPRERPASMDEVLEALLRIEAESDKLNVD